MARFNDLTIQVPNLGGKLQSLLQGLSPEANQRRFLDNPVGYIGEAIPELNVSSDTTQLTNGSRFMRSALQNESFRSWASSYQATLAARDREDDGSADQGLPSREEVLREIGSALIKAGDPTLVADWSQMIADANPQSNEPFVTTEVAVAAITVAIVIGIITAIDFTPYAGPTVNIVTPADIASLANTLASNARR